MSRRAFVVAGIVECLQPDRGGWELIDSHGAGVGGPGVARLRSNHHRSTWLPLRRLPGSGGVVT